MAHALSRPIFRSSLGQRCQVGDTSYLLGGKLGDGAVGIVRRAVRSSDNATVALKFLAPDPKYIEESAFDDVAARFRHEGERGAKLDHERLVKVFGYAENTDGINFRGEGPQEPIPYHGVCIRQDA